MKSQHNRCTRCILSERIPNLTFDSSGVCSFCNDEMFQTNDLQLVDQAAAEIDSLINKYRDKSTYDAVVCYSGGKDSTYTLIQAREQHNLRLLAFTLDNGYLSPFAFDNINRVVERLGVDHIMIKPSAPFMKSLFSATSSFPIFNPRSLVRISANCNACITLVNITALRIALEKDIPFIIAGFTRGQIPVNSIYYRNNYDFFSESREFFLKRLREHLGPEVDRYFHIPQSVINRVEEYPYQLNLLCLSDFREEDIYKAAEAIGWERPTDVDGCSSNCKLNVFNNYMHESIFGFNPYELELSHLIRQGLMSREEALEKIGSQPEKSIETFLEHFKIKSGNIPDIAKRFQNLGNSRIVKKGV